MHLNVPIIMPDCIICHLRMLLFEHKGAHISYLTFREDERQLTIANKKNAETNSKCH